MSKIANLDAVPMPADRPTVSVEEAARWLGVSRATGYEAARSGTLPTIKLGGRRILVPTAALRRLLQLDDAA